jgi:hypothetical protein
MSKILLANKSLSALCISFQHNSLMFQHLKPLGDQSEGYKSQAQINILKLIRLEQGLASQNDIIA